MRWYRLTASSFAAVTVRLAETQPVSSNVFSDRHSSSCPIPDPRTAGETQICVICPQLGTTRLASDMPHNWPVVASNAAYDAGRKNAPQPGYCTMLYRNRRAPSGVRYWALIRLSMEPGYAGESNRDARSC